MSLYGMMRTGVSGMAAQANRLSTVADNIANSSTTGYKRAYTEFSSLVLPNSPGSYNSGGVTTNVLSAISKQGALQYTTSVTDLAVNGNGFLVVESPSGTPFMSRAGAFVPNADGELVNAAGYKLMGYSFANGIPAATANGYQGLEAIRITDGQLTATPSTNGIFSANLPSDAAEVVLPATLPSDNLPSASYTAKSSLVAYDNLGSKVLLDVYFTKTGTGTWEVAVFDQSLATPGTSFPYAPGALLNSADLTFDMTSGQLTGPTTDITVTVPNGSALTLDLAAMTQLATSYTVAKAVVDGNAPSSIQQIDISTDGTLYAKYADGSFEALYRIPLASVQSPDRLISLPGNVFSESGDSGAVRIGFPNEGPLGSVVSGALENSNVDIAEELTNMIESQRSYTANSKVFQTGSDLMDILVNLKR